MVLPGLDVWNTNDEPSLWHVADGSETNGRIFANGRGG
jgi:hypothetical protein